MKLFYSFRCMAEIQFEFIACEVKSEEELVPIWVEIAFESNVNPIESMLELIDVILHFKEFPLNCAIPSRHNHFFFAVHIISFLSSRRMTFL